MHAQRIFNEIQNAEKALLRTSNFIGVFGSGNVDPSHLYYHKAYDLAYTLTKMGFSIITGGGGGIMEAANSGAQKGRGVSAGLYLKFKGYEKKNRFIDPDRAIEFSSFFSRKATFLNHVKSVVVFPGGVGTLDELFEVLLALRAQKIESITIYLVGVSFWKGLIEWMHSNIFALGLAPNELLRHIVLTDNIDEIADGLKKNYLKEAMNFSS